MVKLIRKIIFYLTVFIIISFFVWIGYIVSQGADAAILMYHSVGDKFIKESSINISESAFEQQMKFLHDNHYNVISLLKLAEILKSKAKIPFKTVVLTFDDGYENNYTKAYPILKKYNFPATIFIIVDHIGQNKEMYKLPFQFMSQDMLKEMLRSGLVTIGSHTKSHKFLPKEDDVAVLWDEIYNSKVELEKILKFPVEAFCYPTGGYTYEIERLVKKAGYKVAVTTLHKGKGFAHKDIYALKRIKMTDDDKNPFKLFVEMSGYYLRMKEMGH